MAPPRFARSTLAAAWLSGLAILATGCGDLVGVNFTAVHLAGSALDGSLPDAASSRTDASASRTDSGGSSRHDAGHPGHDSGIPPLVDGGIGSPSCVPKTCAELGATCGAQDDGCGGVLACGTCPGTGSCLEGQCQCQPATCPSLNATCGEQDDGCGHPINCGTCLSSQVCTNNNCACRSTDCAAANANCGTIPDGCGNTLSCGTCNGNDICGGGGANVCGIAPCVPTTCSAQGKNCGSISNGCGGMLNCGSCTAPETCGGAGTANVCGCTPTTCATLGFDCGSAANGCGGTVSCGTCTSPQSCAGAGTANVCGCTPTTCVALGYSCGAPSNGCGGTLSCGLCTSPLTCLAGRCECLGACSCFGAGTDITMADGSHKAIEAVHVGDLIRSFDGEHSAWVSRAVTKTMTHGPDEGTGAFITINGGLRLTTNHPVWVHGLAKRADELAVGDPIVVLTPEGRPSETPVRTVVLEASREVTYDLDVEAPGTFVAGFVVVVHKIQQ